MVFYVEGALAIQFISSQHEYEFHLFTPSTWGSLTMSPPQSFLRQRGVAKETPANDNEEQVPRQRREEVVWGKTPGGEGICDRFSSVALLSTRFTSFPCPDDARRIDHTVPSWVSEKPPGPPKLGLAWPTTRHLLSAATSCLSNLFLFLLRVLARCL